MRFLALVPGRLAFGINMFARLNPSPTDFGLWPDVPKVACKERRNMDPGPEEGTVARVTLQERAKALPLELFLAVKKLSFDGALLADIFARKSTKGSTLRACISKDLDLRALGFIDRRSHIEYTNRVDTENLWVMSPGPARLMIGFLCYESARMRKYAISSLTNPSAKGYCRVKHVHLALGREDAEFAKSFITS